MAQADGVVANGTGAAVRADLNDQLAAVFTNHSGSSEPATTYAYQWWADTTANVLKIRNSANNAWITLRELDGTMLIEDGSASAPGLSFFTDRNSGLFGGSDTIGFATGGAERLEIGSSEVVFNDPSNDVDFRVESNGQTHMLFVDAGNDRVGIAKSSPSARFHVGGTAGDFKIAADGATLDFTRNGANYIQAAESSATLNYRSSQHIFTGSSLSDERARIDSSGRLLVGTSTAPTASVTNDALFVVQGYEGVPTGDSLISLQRGQAPASISSGAQLGGINFGASDGSRYAQIHANSDGTSGTNDYPGRLVFSTTADGGSSPTERLRIDSSGNVTIKTNDVNLQGAGTLRVNSGSTSGSLNLDGGATNHGGEINLNGGSNGGTIQFRTGVGSGQQSEKARIDSSGRLLVGTATSTYNIGNQSKLGVVITGDTSRGGLDITGYTGGSNTGRSPEINFNRSIGTTDGSVTALTAAPWHLGSINFSGSTGSNFSTAASIRALSASQAYTGSQSGGELRFLTVPNSSTTLTERMKIRQDGIITMAMGNTSDSNVASNSVNGGFVVTSTAGIEVAEANAAPAKFNRISSDGGVVEILQAGVQEGSITVSGSTVTYGGGHLARWSQLAGGAERIEILRGSVLSNLDEMCEWAYEAQDAVLYTEEDELPEGVSVGDVKTPAVAAGTEDNEQLNRMKVSDVEGDVNVSGVFQAWDDDDDTYTNDFYCAMTGDFVIRIAQGTTVARGDLLMSAGDGTAKPQDDGIVRSKTIAKVTSTTVSTTYSDGSYCVPCVLMAC